MEVNTLWLAQTTILSGLLIFLVHSLIQYFQAVLVVPKAFPSKQQLPAIQPMPHPIHKHVEEEDEIAAMYNELLNL